MHNFYFVHKGAELSLANLEKVSAENKTKAKDIYNKTLLKYNSKNTIKDFRILSSNDYDKLYTENENVELEKELSKFKLHDTCKLIIKKLIEDELIFPPFTKKQINSLGLDKYNGQDFYVYCNSFSYFGNFASKSDIVEILENLINNDFPDRHLFFSAKTGKQIQLNVTISNINFILDEGGDGYINLISKVRM